jgi:hypothetical protein
VTRSFADLLVSPPDEGELERAISKEAPWRSRVDARGGEAAKASFDGASARAALDDDGVAELRGALTRGACGALLAEVEELRHRGWPLSLIALHEDLWLALAQAPLGPALRDVLGDDVSLTAAPRAHLTTPVEDAEGFALSPSRSPERAGQPGRRLRLWLALADQDADNGGPRALTRHAAPPTQAELVADDVDAVRAMAWLHEARPIPCAAGDALLLDEDAAVWGGRVTARATAPAVSLLLELSSSPGLMIGNGAPDFGARRALARDQA